MAKSSGRELRQEMIKDLSSRSKLRSWNELTRTVSLPAELAAALHTHRVELIRTVTPRAMTADEVGNLYDFIGTLIETNMALTEHAEQLAQLADTWAQSIRGAVGLTEQVRLFANFKEVDDAGDGEI